MIYLALFTFFFAFAFYNPLLSCEAQKERSKKIAILICEKFLRVPTHVDNHELIPALAKQNLVYEEVIWDNPHVEWNQYSAIIVRATWDYIDKHSEFIQTMKQVSSRGIPFYNNFETIKWNSTKSYLSELAQKGILTFPTLTVSRKTTADIIPLISQTFGDIDLVIKPAISGGAHRTFKTRIDSIQELYENHYALEEHVLIQPYMPEVSTEGEWSLMFFNGEFSHAVLSTPKAGDFRVQRMHGGTVQLVTPDATMIKQAQKVLEAVPHGIPLYARIDFIRRGTCYYLMEIELIEPALFMKFDPLAANRFAAAISQKLSAA
jgi:glutathione synthase/RimK-type ligase-like ATP-grasp enzyme